MRETYDKATRLMVNLKTIFNEVKEHSEEELLQALANAVLVCTMEKNMDDVSKIHWLNSRKEKKEIPEAKELLTFLKIRSSNIAIQQSTKLGKQEDSVKENRPARRGLVARNEAEAVKIA